MNEITFVKNCKIYKNSFKHFHDHRRSNAQNNNYYNALEELFSSPRENLNLGCKNTPFSRRFQFSQKLCDYLFTT